MMGVDTTEPGPAVERLRRATRALVTGHLSPDGDSLGSQLAFAELAESLAVDAVVVNHDPLPANLAELPGAHTVVVAHELPQDFPGGFDLAVTLECSGIDRAGFSELGRLPVLNIDHHKANPQFGEVNYVDESAPAVGEMVWRMFDDAGITPSAESATNCYVALSTDTGDFRYSNSTPRAFRAAAEMVRGGASPTQISEWVHERRSLPSIQLLGEALRTLEVSGGGRIAAITVDRAAYDRCGATAADSEDIINHPRSIAGVEAVAFFKQWDTGVVRVSLRSKRDVDVRRVAAVFGGGGHTNAAGCTIEGELAAVRSRVLAELDRVLGGSS
jgi:phosphoesterase RecJ-like protein